MKLAWAKYTEGDTAKLEWTTLLSVGNKSIDDEHKKLIGLVNDVERANRTKQVGNLFHVLERLETLAITHFDTEERFADLVGHPFEEHHLEHQDILEEIRNMKNELITPDRGWSESAAEYNYNLLSEWVIVHISVDDMQLKAKLETYPYDFTLPDIPEYRATGQLNTEHENASRQINR